MTKLTVPPATAGPTPLSPNSTGNDKTNAVFALLFLLLSNISFSQTSHFHLLLNAVNTSFNYGDSNGDLQPYKKGITGGQIGFTFQGGITQRFSVAAEPYFIMKGGTLKNNNPLTTNKSKVRLYQMECRFWPGFISENFTSTPAPMLLTCWAAG